MTTGPQALLAPSLLQGLEGGCVRLSPAGMDAGGTRHGGRIGARSEHSPTGPLTAPSIGLKNAAALSKAQKHRSAAERITPGSKPIVQLRPTRLRSPNRAPVPDRATLRPTPDRTSNTHFHATSSDSAAFARAITTALAGGGRAAGIERASVVGVELHMHPDVGVCSIGYDELIAVLLLRQQRGYAAQPAPDCQLQDWVLDQDAVGNANRFLTSRKLVALPRA